MANSAQSAHAPLRWSARPRGFVPGPLKPHATQRLFCFPYAGAGGSVFARWQWRLPEHIDVWPVELPGRQTRMNEPLCRELLAVARELADCIVSLAPADYSLLGCSLGAQIAYEVAHIVRERGLHAPRHLFVLAADEPRSPPRSELYKLPDDEFLAALGAIYTPIAPALLEEPVTRESLLRVLRADMQMAETYQAIERSPLDCPVTLMTGRRDRSLERDPARGWRAQTRASFEHHELDGDHLFVNTHADTVMEIVSRHMPACVARPARGV